MSRCIKLKLSRKTKTDKVERLPRCDSPHKDLQCKCARWAKDHFEELQMAKPDLPDQLGDRAQDSWEPLLAIADMAGGEWPKLAREAALAISGSEDEADIRIELLADLRSLFASSAVDFLESEHIVKELIELEGRPWAEFKGGKPLTKNQLARLLKAFEIKPEKRRSGLHTQRGYWLKSFSSTFETYLPEIVDHEPATTGTSE
jgi:putative DNA primase/helicase